MILRPGVFLQNRYEILENIGSGGMSEVYRARCHKLNRLVAIKVLKKEFCSDEEFVRKFRLEAQAAAGLNHPNIVGIYDVVDEEELHYIVMELVDGITLKEYIRREGHLEVPETIHLAEEIAEGISAAHKRRIIHRDIKPQNVIMTGDGKLKVADFGIARAVTAQTMSAQAMGSVHYISPEQARGEFTDERSDIYSLGITIYEMVTGRLPFNGDTAVSVALAHIEESLTPPSVYNPDLPVGLEKLILKCAAKDPEERYQSVSVLLKDLEAVAEHPDDVPPGAVAEKAGTRIFSKKEQEDIRGRSRSAPRRRRKSADPEDRGLNRMLMIVAAVLALAIAAAGILIGRQLTRVPETTAAAETQAAEMESTAEVSTSRGISEKETYMPYIIGLSEEEAEKRLREEDLTLTITGREHSDQFQADQVMDQKPAAGDVIPKYSKVSVVVSLGTDRVDLSRFSLYSMSAEEAERTVTELGLLVAKSEEHSDTVEAGKLISYEPENPRKGDTVQFVVSAGPEQSFSEVPNLYGRSEQAAKDLLAASGFIAGNVGRVNSDTVAAGIVLSQSIKAGETLPEGSAVGYVISIGPAVPASAETAETSEATLVEPIGGDTNSRYVASINNTYELNNLIGPGAASTSVTVMVRLRQEVGGSTTYRTLMEPRTVTADTIMPVRFRAIEGAYGVDTGFVEIVDVDADKVLKSYEVQFFKVQ